MRLRTLALLAPVALWMAVCAYGSPSTPPLAEANAASATPSIPPAFASPEQCAALPIPTPPIGPLTVAAWNIRWFPDGTFKDETSVHETDVEWLACTIAQLRVDVLAIQELKTHARAKRATDRLVARLSEITGRPWGIRIDPCFHENQPHVGFLYDQSRARPDDALQLASLNPHGSACAGGQRPGLAAQFEGPERELITLVNVHAPSGTSEEEYGLRKKVFSNLQTGIDATEARFGTLGKLILLGDWNTNGCSDCSPSVSAEEEVNELQSALVKLRPELGLVDADQRCTYHTSGGGYPLDHVAVAYETLGAHQVSVSGLCPAVACRGASPEAFEAANRLSDHCPLILKAR